MNITFFGAFASGLISTLTPCVYPLIPITLSILGAGPETSRSKAIIRAFLYSLGIFASYTVLGLVAIYTGGFFGEIWSSSIFRIILGVLLILFSLYSIGLIKIQGEGIFSTIASKVSSNNTYGPFAIGVVSGVVASPCTGPLLAAILAFAASNPDKTSGFLLLIFYALGFSLPFLILSLFPKLLKKLPKSGSWLYAIKFIIAFFLFAIGCKYLLSANEMPNIFSEYFSSKQHILIALLIISICIKYSVKAAKEEKDSLNLFCLIIASISLLSILLTVEPSIEYNSKDLPSLTKISEAAKKSKSPILVDFTAQWCTQCGQLKENVFSNEEVKRYLKNFVVAEIDLTTLNDEKKQIQKKYKIKGLPAIVFLCPSLKEMQVNRINENVPIETFIKRLSEAKLASLDCKN